MTQPSPDPIGGPTPRDAPSYDDDDDDDAAAAAAQAYAADRAHEDTDSAFNRLVEVEEQNIRATAEAVARGIIRDRYLAQDIVQEAWMSVIRAAAYDPQRGPFRRYFLQVVRNKARDKRKAQEARPESPADDEQLLRAVDRRAGSSLGSPEDAADTTSAIGQIAAALAQPGSLNELQRSLLVCFLDDPHIELAEIARALGKTAGAVRQARHRIPERLGLTPEEVAACRAFLCCFRRWDVFQRVHDDMDLAEATRHIASANRKLNNVFHRNLLISDHPQTTNLEEDDA
ncbi:sigma-70 family RNA polymerase sigma factor [Intrasporangium sp.]|uniref:RNA polymerase sigma factor n=1 Tax=Intrasporangium sp. TaxID=1925024 RepID=UPI00322165EA